ncbi:MAG: tetratricopeptide repeat protein [Nitrospirae bacterium]|nr:tetratricopeptide repeat protein [Nitrospirota bacterium]
MADKTAIMKEAQKYILKGQIDKAISELEKLTSEGPDGNTFNSIGDLYLKKGDKKSAAQYHHKAAGFFRAEGFSLKALALYKKILNTNPSDTDALFALGQLSEEKNLVTDAIKFYLSAADSLSKEGEKEKLIRTYMKILALSPENMPLRSKVAEIFLKEGLVSDASREYVHIAKTFDEKGEPGKARDYYRKVLDLQPSNRDALLGMGQLLVKNGEIDNAVSHMRKAAETFPSDQQIQFFYAELLMQAGRGDEALACISQIRKADPDNPKARQLLADIYLKSGKKDLAWQEYLPIIDRMISEGEKDNALRLLDMFRGVDPVETGKRLVMISRELMDDDLLASELMSLGQAYIERGLKDEARECLLQAADVRPDDEDIQRKLTEVSAAPPEESPRTPVPEFSFSPDPEIAGAPGPAAETDPLTASSQDEKTVQEVFVEAEIFSRYGLLNEAAKLLENLKVREPQNLELHLRLKAIYVETADKESAVTECLVLSELYRRMGDAENSEKVLKEAVNIYPEDPRLEGRGLSPAAGQPQPGPIPSEPAPEITSVDEAAADIEDYDESLAEADFYAGQGLTQEALKVLHKMYSLFPENRDIGERLEALGAMPEDFQSSMMQNGESFAQRHGEFELKENATSDEFTPGYIPIEPQEEPSEPKIVPPHYESEFEVPVSGPPAAETVPEASTVITQGEGDLSPSGEEYENFTLTEQDLVDAQEMPDVALDEDVLDIFQEFKKGLAKELGDEDSETHYNLGIAYKEMGLVDDAITEFQSSRNDPKRFIQSSTMLGVCYMEKGLYSLAIDVLDRVAREGKDTDESYWPVRYDLAEAYERNNNPDEALKLYTAVYGWNARFRNVSEKLDQLKARMGGAAGSGSRDVKKEPEKPKGKKDRVSYL